MSAYVQIWACIKCGCSYRTKMRRGKPTRPCPSCKAKQ